MRRLGLLLLISLLVLLPQVQGVAGVTETFYLHNAPMPNHSNWWNMSITGATSTSPSTMCLNGTDIVLNFRNTVGTMQIPAGNATFHLYFQNASALFRVLVLNSASVTNFDAYVSQWLNVTITPMLGWNTITFNFSVPETLPLNQYLIIDIVRLTEGLDCILFDSTTRASSVTIDPVYLQTSQPIQTPLMPITFIMLALSLGSLFSIFRREKRLERVKSRAKQS